MRIVSTALRLFAVLSCLCGIVYPALVTFAGQAIFSGQAYGTLVYRKGKVVGSSLIGQEFQRVSYFWSRPSATTPVPYNAASSAGSNLAVSNPLLRDQVKSRIASLRGGESAEDFSIPIDLVTTSASGLDPHISPAAALAQISRIARARQVSSDSLVHLVEAHTESRQFGFLGEPRVNVLHLNLALDSSPDR